MFNNQDLQLIANLQIKFNTDENYLDFKDANTKEFTHSYHSYPAMMIPQLPREFLEIMMSDRSLNIKNVYDPFTGSGTTLVEGILKGLEVYGNDINPLSIFMSKVKTTPIQKNKLNVEFDKLVKNIKGIYKQYLEGTYEVTNIPNFQNIDFWFKENIIKELQLIKNYILEIEDNEIKDFFLASFSETVRFVSNTRNNEFKLYRLAKNDLENWNPDVLKIFLGYCERNIDGNAQFVEKLKNNMFKKPVIYPTSSMHLTEYINDESFDLLITSPPYGDSKTTVAYGQFSKLSLQWLGLETTNESEIKQLDNIMLGGKVNKLLDVESELMNLSSNSLNEIYKNLVNLDTKRALEVFQFFKDLDIAISEIARVMKTGSYQYWVVANRTVKKLQIPTDKIIAELFKKYGVEYLTTFYRNIPKKRMPKSNSPTNKKGSKVTTMNKEIIILLKKK